MSLLNVSGSPHVHGRESVSRIMLDVCLALLPAIFVSLLCFGWGALKVLLLSVASCMFFEWCIEKFLMKRESTLGDLSAVVTGILLGLNVPSSLPWYCIVIGSLIAIGVAKMAFGGLGNNIFNPALVGRAFLLISFPVQMTLWPKPLVTRGSLFFNGINSADVDALTGPTFLGAIKQGGVEAVSNFSIMDHFMGTVGGSIGEISALALLVGGIFLLIRKVITWHVPVAFLGSAFVFAGILYLVNPAKFIAPHYHLVVGGMMLGAIFMATDMVTSPMTAAGKLVFGAGCGLLTILIRDFGSYPEGVSFAILIMNAFVPLINRGFKPHRFGVVKEVKNAKA